MGLGKAGFVEVRSVVNSGKARCSQQRYSQVRLEVGWIQAV